MMLPQTLIIAQILLVGGFAADVAADVRNGRIAFASSEHDHQQQQQQSEGDDGNFMMSFPDDQITTNNPCLTHYCPKGRECWVTAAGRASCVCQRQCPYRRKPVCGSNGISYANHCELHRAACVLGRSIGFQKLKLCSSASPSLTHVVAKKTTTTTITTSVTPTSSESAEFQLVTDRVADGTNERIPQPVVDMLRANDIRLNEIDDTDGSAIDDKHTEDGIDFGQPKKGFCSSQEYEIMKDNLLLYCHTRLMTQDNNHSKDFLVSIMFSHYDQNNNGLLEVEELALSSRKERLHILSNGCALDDMLVFDDANSDRVLNINEFYAAFNKMYSLSVVSLDKALETNRLSARVGDNVEIKCDVSGLPAPPIIWRRYSSDLSPAASGEDGIRVLADGSLYLTDIQLINAGNYSCHAQRNKDVMQTHILSVHTTTGVLVWPEMQSRRPGETCEMLCHASGEPRPQIVWLKNNEPLNGADVRLQLVGNGTALRIHNASYADTGAYACRASNIGGVAQEMSSLIVQDEPLPTLLNENRHLFVFHEHGVDVYESDSCRLHHRMAATDRIPGLTGSNDVTLCNASGDAIPCQWGRSIVVGRHLIYVSQPQFDRILIISTVQQMVIETVRTDRFPVDLQWVPQLDQVWVMCWRSQEGASTKSIQVIRNASRASSVPRSRTRVQHSAESIEGQFDQIKRLFVPTTVHPVVVEQKEPSSSSSFVYRYGYVTHENQRGMYKLDLVRLKYTKSIELTLYNCVPENIEFSALYGYVIISCREPVTARPMGQLILDYLTDTVLFAKPSLNGLSTISPDSRIVATVDPRADGINIQAQKVTPHGLEFMFDVMTTLNISATAFYASETVNDGYDLYATASNKDDILFLNMFSGKVEIITGVSATAANLDRPWSNVDKQLQTLGRFTNRLVTTANHTMYVIDGHHKAIHCKAAVRGSLTLVTVVDPRPAKRTARRTPTLMERRELVSDDSPHSVDSDNDEFVDDVVDGQLAQQN